MTDKWQPIETAPVKVKVLVAGRDKYGDWAVSIAEFDPDREVWFGYCDGEMAFYGESSDIIKPTPTWWMRLTPPLGP